MTLWQLSWLPVWWPRMAGRCGCPATVIWTLLGLCERAATRAREQDMRSSWPTRQPKLAAKMRLVWSA